MRGLFIEDKNFFCPLNKCEFCSVAAEEIIDYSLVDQQDNDGGANTESDIARLIPDIHCPCLDLPEPKQQKEKKNCLSCAFFAV